eukprot:gnl/TRDRNA2_/TRDRNA2_63836_c0_seq2.p1 gnl/TRDRNA2_/TRDRNA2_63836_c0~~gnl/TRDRNA2_/TRDRNA2_63836_c0_seq2.p1  ORF type:complete len:164 (+),score=33.68 gnl/TRDRNA2_/TRDRNA2_63836_c0_seq2:74-493(+)
MDDEDDHKDDEIEVTLMGKAKEKEEDDRTRRTAAAKQRWTCQLCSQTRNTIDSDKCITCGRKRGHQPMKYNRRSYDYDRYAYDEDYYGREEDEEFKWSDAWGLIAGLILLVIIAALLIWAYIEDQKDLAREASETETEI